MIRIRRREFLAGSAGALLALGPVARASADVGAPLLILDFSGAMPNGASFKRASVAAVRDEGGFATADVNEPRFERTSNGSTALLVEGALDRSVAPLAGSGKGRGVEGSVFGDDGAVEVTAGAPGGSLVVSTEHAPDNHMVTASVFARSEQGGRWSIGLRAPYINDISLASADLGPEWTRLVVSRPSYAYEPDPLEFHLVWAEEGKPAAPSAILWGAAIEKGFVATSPLPPGVDRREADELRVSGALFERSEGTVTLHLPEGGTRGGVFFEAASGSFSLAMDESGRLEGHLGGLRVGGFEDASADTVVEFSWSPDGIGVASGTADKLLHRAFTDGNPGIPQTDGEIRLMAAYDGSRSANTLLGRLELAPRPRVTGPVKGPVYAPSGYEMVFGDDFDDPDTSRINEEGRGNGPGPYWRSRYRWSRFDVINQEKQVYVDRDFAGNGQESLGIDPFTIADGVLGITARRLDETQRGLLNGALYASGTITSERSHTQTYGYFEMRCRIPEGRGFWPAFWLLPKQETWPPEIDILEASGARPYSFSSGAIGDGADLGQQWLHGLGNLTKSFHTFAMEWTKSDIVLFFDGREVRRGKNFVNQPMFVLANLAVGSHEPRWIPDPDENTPDQGTLEIDYLRCWSRK